MKEKELDQYLKETQYLGFIKGNYREFCILDYDEINNFVQNAGLLSDLEIVRTSDMEMLFDTNGQFVNRIWPELSYHERMSDDIRETINQIAGKLFTLRENDTHGTSPIQKVKEFVRDVKGAEAAELLESMMEPAETFQEIRM